MGHSLMQLRRGVLLNTPHLATASGELATFQTDMAAKLKKLFTSFEPVQSFNGFDKPWPPGGSINLIDQANAPVYTRWFNNSDKWANSADSRSFAFPCQPSTTYTISTSNSSVGIFRVGYITVALPTSTSVSPQLYDITRMTQAGAVTLTTSSDATYIIVQISASLIRTADLMIEVGSTASTYVPYANICPISGHTGINFTRAGANLANRIYTSANIYNAGNLIPVKTGEKIYVYAEYTYTSSPSMWAAVYASRTATGKNNYLVQYSSFTSGQVKSYTITRDGYFGVAYNAGVATYTVSKMMISKTPITSAADYVPYDPTVIPVSWQSEAGTVYGGTLDAATGALTVLAEKAQLLSSWTWYRTQINGEYFFNTANLKTPLTTYKNLSACDTFKLVGNPSTMPNPAPADMTIINAYSRYYPLNIRYDAITSVEDFKTFLANNEVNVVLQRSAPQIIQLSPAEVRALVGANNIWSETGEVETEYWTHI